MKTIRYRLHFSILSVAAAILWFARNLDLPARIVNFRLVHYGLMGALHAAAIVVSLRDRKAARPISVICFIGLAAVWSAATPILAIWTSFVWLPVVMMFRKSDLSNVVFFLFSGSAIGAAGYWFLARQFWFKSLRASDLLKAVGLCLCGTAVAVAVVSYGPRSISDSQGGDVADMAITVAWWFAFSGALYWSETRGAGAKSKELAASLS